MVVRDAVASGHVSHQIRSMTQCTQELPGTTADWIIVYNDVIDLKTQKVIILLEVTPASNFKGMAKLVAKSASGHPLFSAVTYPVPDCLVLYSRAERGSYWHSKCSTAYLMAGPTRIIMFSEHWQEKWPLTAQLLTGVLISATTTQIKRFSTLLGVISTGLAYQQTSWQPFILYTNSNDSFNSRKVPRRQRWSGT